MPGGAGCSRSKQLRVRVSEGTIDTVVLAFTDMQGRLQGKRLSAEFFLAEVVEHHAEGCNYLLAVDVEMNTVDGYAMSSWERGYGDFVLRTRPLHVAADAVARGDRPGAGRPGLGGREPVVASPRQILKAQAARLAERGWTAFAGTELEFVRLHRDLRAGPGEGLPRPHPGQPVQHRLLHPRTAPGGAAAAPDPARHGRRGPVRRVVQGRVQPRPARDRLPLCRRASTTCDNHSIYKTGAKEIAAAGRHEHHLHGQAEPAGGQLLPHPPVAARRATAARCSPGDGPSGLSPVGEHFLAGQLAALREMSLFFAPNINSYKRYVPGSFAPTAIRWGVDNRTCAYRLVGHGLSLRSENRVPGGDVNPYLAIAAMIAGGLHGIENELPLEPAFTGNAYADPGRGCPPPCGTRCGVGEERAGPGGVRGRRGRALRQLRPGGAGRLRRGGHRLGAAARLRALLTLAGPAARDP